MNRLSFALAMLIIAVLCSTSLRAQTETGQIAGTVTDPTGALIPNAKVTVRAVATDAIRTTQTNQSGVYIVPNLSPGVHMVSVESPGFATKQARAQVNVGGRVGLDFSLEVGQAETIIEVAETAGQINTESQTVQQVIGTRQIMEMPSLTRNPYDFVVTSGNVSENDPATGRGVGVAINGQRSTSTGILLDGAQNTDDYGAAIGISVPLDSVQEYSILQNNYTAEYGRAAGGIVNVLTKSGTNDLHGSIYHFYRSSALAANTFENNANGLPKPTFVRNQFGYSVGGPIVRNKLFFFNSTEWTRVRSAASTTAWIPTDQLVGLADPATQNFFTAHGALRQDLVKFEALTKDELAGAAADPCAGAAAGGPCEQLPGNTPMFTRVSYNHPADAGGGSPRNLYQFVIRGDYNLSERFQMYGRWARERDNIFAGYQIYHSPYAGFDSPRNLNNDSGLLSLVGALRPTIVMQTKFLFSRLNDIQPYGEKPPGPTLFFRSGQTNLLGNGVALPGYLPFNPSVGVGAGGPQNTSAYYQDLSIIRGGHQLRMGGQYMYIQQNRTFAASENASEILGTNLGSGLDNFLLGQVRQFTAAIDPKGKFPCADPTSPDPTCTVQLPVTSPSFSRSNRYHEFAVYFQDTWKVVPRLTLNLGLRYEYFGVQHNNNEYLDSNYYDAPAPDIFLAIRNGGVAQAPYSAIGGLWRPDWNNFAPRVGFAYDLTGDGRTSIRGGYGISYDRNFGNVTFNVIQNPPAQAVLSLIAGTDVPSIAVTTSNAGPLAGSSGTKALLPVSLRNVDSNIRTAYAHQWSMSFERQFGQSLVGAVEYVGSKGTGLYTIENVNRAGFGNAYLGDPCDPAEGDCTSRLRPTQYTGINRRGGKGFSTYNGANFRLDVNAVAGLTLRANYTWSHAIDNLSTTFSESDNQLGNLGLLDPFQPELDKGDADFDVRHRIALGGVWDIFPARSGSGITRRIFGGWQLAPIFTARTGNAFTIWDSTDATVEYLPRAFFTGSVPRKPSGTPAEIGPNTFQWMDLSTLPVTHWVNPATGTSNVGPFPSFMSGRNAFRGPGFWNLNLGIHKNFDVTERVTLQFRGELFNAFNHSNLWVVGADADVGDSDVIAAQRGVPPSYIGGDERRGVQLALKILF